MFSSSRHRNNLVKMKSFLILSFLLGALTFLADAQGKDFKMENIAYLFECCRILKKIIIAQKL